MPRLAPTVIQPSAMPGLRAFARRLKRSVRMEDILPVSDPFEVVSAIVARVAVDVVDFCSGKVCVRMPSHCDEPVNV